VNDIMAITVRTDVVDGEGQVRDASRIEDGVQIDAFWLLTAPIDQMSVR